MKPSDLIAAVSIAVLGGALFVFIAALERARRRALRRASGAAASLPGLRALPVRYETEKAHREHSGFSSSIGLLFAGKERLVFAHRRFGKMDLSTKTLSGGDYDLLEIPLDGLALTRHDKGKFSWVTLAANGVKHHFRIDRVLVFGTERLAFELERDLNAIVGQAPACDPLAVPPEQGGPLVVIRRREVKEIWRIGIIPIWGLVAGTVLMGMAWLRDSGADTVFRRHFQLLGVSAFFGTGALVFVARRLFGQRAGEVALYDDRIEIEKGSRVTVRWEDLAGYRDDSIDFVQLVGKSGGAHAVSHAIPTPTEHDRTATLALLDRKGLRRLES